MSSEISEMYAVVNKPHILKNKRALLPRQFHNDPVPGVYARVNKTGKVAAKEEDTTDDNYDLIAPIRDKSQVSQAEVKKAGKSTTTGDSIKNDDYDLICPDNLNHHIVSDEPAHDLGMYDFAKASSEDELERLQSKSPKLSNIFDPYVETTSKPAWVLACLIILTLIVIAAAIATVVALALMTKLQSDLENYNIIELNRKINNLHSEFDVFSTNTTSQLITLKTVTDESSFIQMLHHVSQSLFQLKNNTINELITNITIIEMNFNESLTDITNTMELIIFGLQVTETIINASIACNESVETLTDNFSLLRFPSSDYTLSTINNTTKFCSIFYTCDVMN